jgi:hypothetical protein
MERVSKRESLRALSRNFPEIRLLPFVGMTFYFTLPVMAGSETIPL